MKIKKSYKPILQEDITKEGQDTEAEITKGSQGSIENVTAEHGQLKITKSSGIEEEFMKKINDPSYKSVGLEGALQGST